MNEADTLRKKAEALTPRINALAVLRPTHTRRMREQDENRQGDLRKLRATQAFMLRLSLLHAGGSCPPVLSGLRATSQCETLVAQVMWDQRDCDTYQRNTPGDRLSPAARAVREMVMTVQGLEDTPADKLRRMERDIQGRQIPGFFATQRPVVELMIAEADIIDGMTIFEPEAGKGDIVDVLAERFPKSPIHYCEINPNLREIMAIKDHRRASLVGTDLMEYVPPGGLLYDRIVMNPPFEKGEDIIHVTHCFNTLLAPGGRLVAIMSPGSFFRTDKRTMAFRQLVRESQGSEQKLPEDSFKASGTGVNATLVVMHSQRTAVPSDPVPEPIDVNAFELAAAAIAKLAERVPCPKTIRPSDLSEALEVLRLERQVPVSEIDAARNYLMRLYLNSTPSKAAVQ